MADATHDFFRHLAKRTHEPLWAKVTGAVRVEVAGRSRVDHWIVAINKGEVTVSRDEGAADAGMSEELVVRHVQTICAELAPRLADTAQGRAS